MQISINTRILSQPITGVQRYLLSILQYFPQEPETIRITGQLHGIKGHAWEQFVLPFKLGRSLLWSPSNTGPLLVKNQVVTIHDTVPLDHPEWLNPRFARWHRFLVPRLARRAKKIIAISNFTKTRIIETCNVPENKISVVYNGVDKRFNPEEPEVIEKAKKKMGIGSARYILSLGSIEPRKNLTRLIQAWRQIESTIPDDIWLVLAGGAGAKRIYENVELENLPARVLVPGHVEDNLLPALYSGAIAMAYVSLYEGFGLPALEAMACGCPVITSNTTALPEVVGHAAFTVNPHEVSDIAEKLLQIIYNKDLRIELSQIGKERASEFSWEKTAEKTLNILKQCT